jgi:uncharacterized protein YndB with AHSA1/START domain
MNEAATETRSVVIERELPHPPDRIWRALTQPHLLREWLMNTDFSPVMGHRFRFDAEWGGVDCEVLEIEPQHMLAYSWNGLGLESVVTWTLTPAGSGTRLRMEQTGFKPDQQQAYYGARAGWPRFLARLEAVLARAD